MQYPSLAQIKKELSYLTDKELVEIITDLSKFSRDNKAYLFFKLNAETQPNLFVEMVQEELTNEFDKARDGNYFYAKKSAQKIRRQMNKLLKLTKNKAQQVEVILFFCEQMKEREYLAYRHPVLENLFEVQLSKANKLILGLHEDLQYDYQGRLEELR